MDGSVQIIMNKGPTGSESDSEIDKEPTPQDVRGTVEWAVTTENADTARFYFEDNGEMSDYFHLLGQGYNLTGLSEDRVENAQRILSDWCFHETELEPQDGANGTYIFVSVDATVEEHKQLFESLINEVYDVTVEDISKITRSTYEKVEDSGGETSNIESTKSEFVSKEDPKQLREKLEQIDINLEDGDLGGHIQLDEDINLNMVAIGLGLEDIKYEPELFPGLIYRVKHDGLKTTVVIFEEGQIIAVDSIHESAVKEAVTVSLERLQELGILDSEVAVDNRITISETQA